MAENNRVAPKFQTNFVGHDLPQDQGIDRLKYWANEFLRLGLAPDYGEGAYGNLSFRTKSGFIITCTRFGPADIDHSQSYVQVTDVDLNKMVVHAQGMREPSSESMLHYAVYKARSDVNAIFHGHYDAILNDKRFVCTKKEEKYGSIELVNSVLEVLGNNNFVIMKNHGFLVMGKDMGEAGRLALSIV